MKKKVTRENDVSKIKDKSCGIIMPINPHPEYPADHWNDVLQILMEAVEETDFEPNLVSDDVAIGLIHDRIVTNIYNNEIIICDVSSKNPNVMFELGLRLAFDKPTIIIKDDTTGYSFDTGVIEHLSYPSSLRFAQIQKFKVELVRRINATYKKSVDEPNYSPFLKSFGKTIVPATIQQTEVSERTFIINQLKYLNNQLQNLRLEQQRHPAYTKWTEQENRRYTDKRNPIPINIINSLMKERTKDFEIDGYVDKFAFTSTLYEDLLKSGFNVQLGDLKVYVDDFFEKSSFKDKQ